ncbi:hypothetical protein [Streptomyces phaeochromogenes]|uniref:hypothetical protein n=1 Tax=Streptomyces phaeochromogenes TaxID=1923 RepID=UPI002DDA18CB|nr:hypothetical protein [Streptomyces phaeochromogenes]WRZ28066.1 hypothetical protein OG931_10065 [Streptomyces phaeochromogenes]
MSRKNPENKPCRRTGLALRPAPQAPGRTLNDRVVNQVFSLVRHSGALERLPSDDHKPGPKGMPFRTVLIGLILSQYMGKSANIDDAWETLFFALSPGAKALLDVPDIDLDIPEGATCEEIDHIAHKQYAMSKRVYRSWTSMTKRLDPAPHDRRKRLTLGEAKKIRRKWNALASADTVRNLEAIAQDLILAPVMASYQRGDFARWHGHVAVDDTPVPVWGKEPDYLRDRASLEITAGMYVKGGASKRPMHPGGEEAPTNTGTRRGAANRPATHKTKPTEKKTKAPEKKEFRYAMMAAFPGHGHGDLAGAYPAVCLGMILHTPGTEPGPAALRAIQPAFERGMVKDLFCADRGISQAKPHNLHLQLLKLGLNAVKHYNDDKVDQQGQFRGMQLVGGEFYCPMMPTPLVTAGTTYINSRTDEDRAHALNLIQSRKDFQTKVKEYGPAGDQRRQCPALGPHATVTCYRRPQPRPSTIVDLDAPTVRTPAALPTIPKPKRDTGTYPDICTGKSITVPGTVLAKWRQKYALFTPLWQEAWSGLRSQNEGGNGNLKKSALDSIDNPQFRLPHGRVAQTLLNAVIIFVANLRAIQRFHRDQGIQPRKNSTPRTAHQSAQPTDPPRPQPLPTETAEPPPRE